MIMFRMIATKTLIICTLLALAVSGERIVGGQDAEPGEFPSLVAVMVTGMTDGSLLCAGSLVADTWVVTSGTCCDGVSASKLSVKVGSYHLFEADPDQEIIQVKRAVLHPEYDIVTISNDICLLELESSVTLGPNVGLLSLPDEEEEYEDGLMCTFIGWGTVSAGGLAPVVQKADLPIVSDETCRWYYGLSEIADSMLCAGFQDGHAGPCQGDTGGPLMCGKQLSGINSWGYGCALPEVYNVFTQTSHFVDWINYTII